MKSLITNFLACSIFLLSCQNPDTPQPTQSPTVNTVNVDAAAVTKYIKEYCHWLMTDDECFKAATTYSVVASLTAASQGPGPVNPLLAPLPTNLELEPEINPLEALGRNHNLMANGVNELGGISAIIVDLANYDSTVWTTLLFKDPSITTTQQANSVIEYVRGLDAHSYIEEKVSEIYQTNSFSELAAWIGLDEVHEFFIVDVMETHAEMRANDSSVTAVATYLNSRIEYAIANIFQEEWTIDDVALLAYLTVLKHSDCYWREM